MDGLAWLRRPAASVGESPEGPRAPAGAPEVLLDAAARRGRPPRPGAARRGPGRGRRAAVQHPGAARPRRGDGPRRRGRRRDDVDLAHWRAQLLYARAAQRHYRNEPKALADLQQAAQIVDPRTDPFLAALVLNGRAIWEGFEGRIEQQIGTLTQALDIVQRADDERSAAVRVAVRINLAEILPDLGDTERALSLLTAALPDCRELGDPEQLEQVHSTAVAVAGLWLARPDGVERAPADRRADLVRAVQGWADAATEAARGRRRPRPAAVQPPPRRVRRGPGRPAARGPRGGAASWPGPRCGSRRSAASPTTSSAAARWPASCSSRSAGTRRRWSTCRRSSRGRASSPPPTS